MPEPYEFTVFGDPVGAVRMTRKQKYSKKAGNRKQIDKHISYAKEVRWQFMEQLGHRNREREFQMPSITLANDAVAVIEFFIAYRNEKHPDPENVMKLVTDALFTDDKHVLSRCMGLKCRDENPRVEVRITICPKKNLETPLFSKDSKRGTSAV